MSASHDMQQKPNTKLRDLFKSNKYKTRKLSEPSKTEQNRVTKLNRMLDERRRGGNAGKSVFVTKADHKSTQHKKEVDH